MRLLRLFAAILFSLCVASVAALSASLPFTRQVNQSFGSEPSQVPFYALFVFFAVDRQCRFNLARKHSVLSQRLNLGYQSAHE